MGQLMSDEEDPSDKSNESDELKNEVESEIGLTVGVKAEGG